jgi:capsule polysaccharide export protein KpsE/RkpR
MSPQNSYIDEGAALDYAPVLENHPPAFGFSLMDVLTQLARRKQLLAKGAGVGMLTGVLLSLVLPVRYTAVTTLMPPQQTPSTASMLMSQLTGSGASPLAALAGGGLGLGLKNPNDIYIGLLDSRPIADAIIRQFGLARLYRSKDMTAAREKLANNTVIASEKNGFLTVSVTDKDKQRAAAMANAFTEGLRVLTKTLAVTEASQRRLFYEEQMKQARESLVDAEVSFQQVQQSKGLVQLDAQAKAMIERLAVLRAQVAAQEVNVQALRSYSTEQNPDLELAERELSSLQAEAAQLEQRNHSSGFADWGMGDVPGAGMEYLRAEHEVKYRQAMFDLLIKQYDAARLDEAKDAAIIQVVEPAIAPDRKSSPQRALIVLLCTAAGLFAAGLLVLLAWWHKSVQSDPRTAGQLSGLRHAVTGKS